MIWVGLIQSVKKAEDRTELPLPQKTFLLRTQLQLLPESCPVLGLHYDFRPAATVVMSPNIYIYIYLFCFSG